MQDDRLLPSCSVVAFVCALFTLPKTGSAVGWDAGEWEGKPLALTAVGRAVAEPARAHLFRAPCASKAVLFLASSFLLAVPAFSSTEQ